MPNLELTEKEVRLLIQSLEHCLATSKNADQSSGGPCADCEAAKALRDKLAAKPAP